MHPFSNPWKHQKTLWFSMGKGALGTNGLRWIFNRKVFSDLDYMRVSCSSSELQYISYNMNDLNIQPISYNMNDNRKNNILMSVPTLRCYFSHYRSYYMFCNCQEQLFFNLFQSEILRRYRNRTQHHSALQILAEMFDGDQSLCQQFSQIYQHPTSSSKYSKCILLCLPNMLRAFLLVRVEKYSDPFTRKYLFWILVSDSPEIRILANRKLAWYGYTSFWQMSREENFEVSLIFSPDCKVKFCSKSANASQLRK